MRHFDLTPHYRSTIGFDRLGSLLDTLTSFEGETPSYPPYNIERVGENEYRIWPWPASARATFPST